MARRKLLMLAAMAQAVVAIEAEAMTVVVKGEAMVAVEMAPVRRAGTGTTIGVGSLDTRLVTAAARSLRRTRKNMPLRPRKKNQPSCLWRSTSLRCQI
jgi:hypothetical protein